MAGPTHHTDRAEIAGRPRHQIASAVALEVREIEPLQVREEVVAEVVLDVAGSADNDPTHQEAKHTPDCGERQQDHGIEADFAGIHAAPEIVDGVFQHPRTRQPDRGCRDNADESEEKGTAIPEEITQEPAARGHC